MAARLISLPLYAKAPLLALAYAGLAYFGSGLYAAGDGSAYFWPANALVAVVLCTSPMRQWGPLLIAAALTEFLLDRYHLAMPPLSCLGLAAANALEAGVAAYLTRRFVGDPPSLDNMKQLRSFLIATVAIPPLLSSLLGVSALRFAGLTPSFASGWWPWWLGDALGMLLVAPGLLALTQTRLSVPKVSASRALEIFLFVVLTVLVFHGFGQELAGSEAALLRAYLLFPLLIWIGLRFGRTAAGVAMLVASLALVWGSGHGLGPFMVTGSSAQALGLQNFLIISALTSLALSTAVAQRQRSERFSHKVIEGAPNALLMVNAAGRIALVNAQAERIFGYARAQLIGQSIDTLLPASARAAHARLREDFFQRPEARAMGVGRALLARRVDGSEFPVEIGLNPVETEDGPMVLAAVVDISERKRAEEALRRSEERFELAVRGSTDGIWDWDFRNGTVYRSPRWYELLGYTPDELSHEIDAADALIHPDDQAQRREAMARSMATGAPLNLEHRLRCKNGAYRWFLGRAIPLVDVDGKAYRLCGSLTDIHERRTAQAQLEVALAEKTVLLKEVHHRVKNNLQVVSSLLNLQGRQTQEPHAQAVLAESHGRVMAMSLIHQLLYERDDFARIDLAEYLQRLVTLVREGHQPEYQRVALELDLNKIYLDLERAVPCGLVVNELLTNAYKHAFPNGRSGKIKVSLHDVAVNEALLSICDDGVGLPAGMDALRAKSLGLQLVPLLTDQLGGRVSVGGNPGTRFDIQFSLRERAAA